MKHLVISILMASSVHAIPILSCFNNSPTRGVSFSYENCVNRNFREVRWKLRLNLNNCTNYSNQVDPSYIYCIERNFDIVDRALSNTYLRSCSNYGAKLSYFFQSCVNDNFRKIERIIR